LRRVHHAGSRAQHVDQFHEQHPLPLIVQGEPPGIHRGHHHRLGFETEIRIEQVVQTAAEEPGAGDQHRTERHLSHEERAMQEGPAAARRAPRGGAEIARGPYRRHEAEGHASDEAGEDRETNRPAVILQRQRDRIVDCDQQRAECRGARPGDHQPERGARGREQQALGQQLPHDPPLRCTDREAYRDLR
jgi:hypothetical protein